MRTITVYVWMAWMVACLMGLTSCGSGEKKETIENSFFGVELGASKEEVKDGFTKHGMSLDEVGSTDDMLDFFPNEGDSIMFADMKWHQVHAGFFKGKFLVVNLYTIHENDSVAEQDYNRIRSVLETKCKMNDIPLENMPDTMTLKCCGYTNGRAMSLTLRKGHSKEGEPRWYCSLQYCDPRIADERTPTVRVIDKFRQMTNKR